MVVLTYDVDPQGDLVVVLQEPNTTRSIPEVSIRQPGTHKTPSFQIDQDILNLPKVSSLLPSFDSSEETVEVRIRVSSFHMKLASPMFERMLNGPWRESTSPESSSTPAPPGNSVHLDAPIEAADEPPAVPGVIGAFTSSSSTSPTTAFRIREVIAHGWNADALLVVLNVIHGINDQVPRELSVEFLAEIASIVNYYHCQRAMQFAGEVWQLRMYTFPSRYGMRCIVWLSIAWAFGWEEFFDKLASYIIENGEGLCLIKPHDIPINSVLDKLDAKRQDCIAKIVNRLDELSDELLDGRTGCDHRCSSMLLGSLLRERHDSALLNPAMPSPYTGYSVHEFIKKVICFRVMEWGRYPATSHGCTIMALMQPSIHRIENEMRSFKISHSKDN
ncbi:hypothetical protein NW761_002509 [Fusarium oxysporum]|nr:hypothetical protein NW758_001008 [Fusarium oxysporum]KAJ4103711.1 hypothetical protein NW761_002509 [Fusarium oxysporum]